MYSLVLQLFPIYIFPRVLQIIPNSYIPKFYYQLLQFVYSLGFPYWFVYVLVLSYYSQFIIIFPRFSLFLPIYTYPIFSLIVPFLYSLAAPINLYISLIFPCYFQFIYCLNFLYYSQVINSLDFSLLFQYVYPDDFRILFSIHILHKYSLLFPEIEKYVDILGTLETTRGKSSLYIPWNFLYYSQKSQLNCWKS